MSDEMLDLMRQEKRLIDAGFRVAGPFEAVDPLLDEIERLRKLLDEARSELSAAVTMFAVHGNERAASDIRDLIARIAGALTGD